MSLQTSSKIQGSDAGPGVLESKVLICAFTPQRRMVFTIRWCWTKFTRVAKALIVYDSIVHATPSASIRRWRHVTKCESSIVVRRERGTAPFRN